MLHFVYNIIELFVWFAFIKILYYWFVKRVPLIKIWRAIDASDPITFKVSNE